MNEERNKERTEGRKKTGETEAKKDIKRANDERKKKRNSKRKTGNMTLSLCGGQKNYILGIGCVCQLFTY